MPGPYALAMAGLASVLNQSEPIGQDAAGISWRDETDGFNALLRIDGKLAHVQVPQGEGPARATVYAAPVEAVEADGVREVPGHRGISWRVDVWHITLRDGAVITLRSVDDGHAEALAHFVQRHLLP